LAGVAYFVALYLGWLLFGLAAGGLLVRLGQRANLRVAPSPEALVILGLVALYFVTHLPGTGILVGFVALCLGFGAPIREVLSPRAPPPATQPLAA
jgi:hypothetical protein